MLTRLDLGCAARSVVLIATSALPLVGCAGTGGSEPHAYAAGLEVQAYPAGVISAAHVRRALSEHDTATLRLGYNDTNRRDYGEHDDEEGGGPGGGIGWRHYRGPEYTGWLYGARIDLWDLEIDWEEDDGSRGTTDVLVLQPTVEGGYAFRLGDSPWRLELVAAFGAEVNVDTDGEDVGEGAIGLVGLTLTRAF